MQLKDSFDELLNQRIANAVEESLLEKAKSEAIARELKELLTKWTALQDEYQNTNSELREVCDANN